MPETIDETIAWLETLEKATTPGDWHVEDIDGPYFDRSGERWVEGGYRVPEAEALGNGECGAMKKADAQLIVELRNAFPALAAAYRAQGQAIATLKHGLDMTLADFTRNVETNEMTLTLSQEDYQDLQRLAVDPPKWLLEQTAALESAEAKIAQQAQRIAELEPDSVLVEQALARLSGPPDEFRETLTNAKRTLQRVCRAVKRVAKKKRCEPWVVIGELTSHGSGVSSAIYRVYGEDL